ncbi:MAG: hypothetical protein ACLPUO_11815 [Streptosporangiaceae bacterium]|jgi:hypothetical protein
MANGVRAARLGVAGREDVRAVVIGAGATELAFRPVVRDEIILVGSYAYTDEDVACAAEWIVAGRPGPARSNRSARSARGQGCSPASPAARAAQFACSWAPAMTLPPWPGYGTGGAPARDPHHHGHA